MNQIELDITPIAKPRMTRRDKWLNPSRPIVAAYWAFKNEIALKRRGFILPDAFRVLFYIPMPKTWSNRKKAEFSGTAHKQTPDLDNMIKALCDAFKVDDSEIYNIHAIKLWGETGKIKIEEI